MIRRLAIVTLTFGVLLSGGVLAAEDDAAAAAKVTDAQKKAVRSHCAGDFLAHCLGVRPGGIPAFQCLNKHMSNLSSGCQAAVKSILADAN